MTELLHPPLGPEYRPTGEEWEMQAYQYCLEHYKQTAASVIGEIEYSDYVYGIEQWCQDPPYGFGRSEQVAWKLHEYTYDIENKPTKAIIYLMDNAQLTIDWDTSRHNALHDYTPGSFDDNPSVFIAAYINMVGLVKDEAFRERELAFLVNVQ